MTKLSSPPPLLSPRSALILLLAALCGVVVGVLTAMAGKTIPEAVVGGILAAGGAAVGANAVIGP